MERRVANIEPMWNGFHKVVLDGSRSHHLGRLRQQLRERRSILKNGFKNRFHLFDYARIKWAIPGRATTLRLPANSRDLQEPASRDPARATARRDMPSLPQNVR